jgi:hypothetical protein
MSYKFTMMHGIKPLIAKLALLRWVISQAAGEQFSLQTAMSSF